VLLVGLKGKVARRYKSGQKITDDTVVKWRKWWNLRTLNTGENSIWIDRFSGLPCMDFLLKNVVTSEKPRQSLKKCGVWGSSPSG
jgi:hypothetical protein